MTSLLAAQLARRQSLISLVPDRASWPPDLGRSGPTPSSEMPQRSTLRQGPNPGGHLLGTPPGSRGWSGSQGSAHWSTLRSVLSPLFTRIFFQMALPLPAPPRLGGFPHPPTITPTPYPPPPRPRRRPQAGPNLPPQQGPLRGQLSHSFILCMRKLSPREGNRLPEALHLVAHEMQGPPSPGMTS